MKFKLVIEKGKPEGVSVTIGDGETVVGRSHAATLRLEEPDVSGKHVRVVCSGERVVAENLSRFGAAVDGKPLNEPMVLKPGQRLQIGKKTVILFDVAGAGDEAAPAAAVAGASAAAAGDEDRTDEGIQPAAPKAAGVRPSGKTYDFASRATNAFVAAPEPKAEAADDETGVIDEDERTREMATRVPAAEELEFLKQSQARRARNRLMVLVGGIAAVAALCIAFWPRSAAPEDVIEWPADEAGEPLEGKVEAPLKGFHVVYPDSSAEVTTPNASELMIECWVGVNRDVPLTLRLAEEVDKQLVSEDRARTLSRWIERVSGQGGKWSFDAPLKIPVFLGPENGIPVVFLSYQRGDIETGDAWYGTARLFRVGSRLAVLRAEVPAAERVRAEDLLSSLFLDAGRDFVRRHWDGAVDVQATPPGELVDQARVELRRDAPATWTKVEQLLFAALRRASMDDKAEVEAEALKWLVTLRDKQAMWFNRKWFARLSAIESGDEEEAKAVAEPCAMIFSNMDDQRFYEVRRW